MSDAVLTTCTCGKEGQVKRLLSAGSGLIFKGSGFYITDYKNANASGAPAPAASTTSESAPATTTPAAATATPAAAPAPAAASAPASKD
jgi:predicted nucleic acid-binding Zn ribbon protein